MAKSIRVRRNGGREIGRRNGVITSDNDTFAAGMSDIVPAEFRDSDRYLNVVQWNLEWFGATKSAAKDKQRRALVVDILRSLNADLFVFQEIAGPTTDGRRPGALDSIAEELTAMGVGEYVVDYTKAGGEQRVAMMWDREWLRAKDEVAELFPKGQYQTGDQKDPFAGRTPLYGYFTARVPDDGSDSPGSSDKFEFQALGVHLKAMGDGAPQRRKSAEVLADWMTKEAPKIDADVMILGDWNAPPDDKASWKPFHDMERAGKVKFQEINDPSDFSYLWLANTTSRFVSRIDLTAMSAASMEKVTDVVAKTVRWKPIEDALRDSGSLTAPRVREIMKELKETISDHLPTATRFFFKPPAE
jgi:hypothetical protein